MKIKLMLLLTFVISTDISAQNASIFPVLIRKEKSNRTFYKEVELEDLVSDRSFDGKYFKIVKEKSNEAINFDTSNEMLKLKAATVYYHLTLARNYWKNIIQSQSPVLDQKLIIRLEIKNVYDDLGHFANDNRTPQFNNALSIPEGQTPDWLPSERQDKWNKEIWFRPMKKILVDDLSGMGPNPLTMALEALERPFLNYTQNQFDQALVEHLFYPAYATNPLWEDVVRFAGTIALTKVIIESSKYADRLFVDKYYYLDTAMVPEVIYHEYAHIVLSDFLELSHSTPVVEGMADFFAASLANKKKIYARVKGHSNAASKDTENKKIYEHWYESNKLATSDFVLSVLWDVQETLGQDSATSIIYETRTRLKTGTASINNHLLQAILDTCSTKCSQPRKNKLMLYETFSKKGF